MCPDASLQSWQDNPRLEHAREALHRHFGHSALRPFQAEAIAAWAQGRDVIVTLATGAGKSLCFQLPALLEPPGRWALVVSPLVALMQDQVCTLRQRNISAGVCGSGARKDTVATLESMRAGKFRVVYMCPEFALKHLDELASLRQAVCLFAIDEAHCISSWGQDFRPQYRELGKLRLALGMVPTICVTATCTEEVRSDILQTLQLRPGLARVVGPMNRANLRIIVRDRTTLEADLGELFACTGTSSSSRSAVDNTCVCPTSSTIIYTATKASCDEVARWLKDHAVAAEAYHAGLSMTARHNVHRAFILDEVQVVVATVAFGMGIDKPSIRRVVHYGGIRSLEHYVQQCGRAGRDGDDAECIAFTRPQDTQEARALILQDFSRQPELKLHCERLLALHAQLTTFLADGEQCRRVRLLRHFGEVPTCWPAAEASDSKLPPRGECVQVGDGAPNCRWCDVCLSRSSKAKPGASTRSGDFSKECLILLRCVVACGGMTGAGLPIALAAGQADAKVKAKRLDRSAAFGSGSHRSPNWWKAFLPHVRQAGLLQERPATLACGRSYAALSVSDSGQEMLGGTGRKDFCLSPVPKVLDISPPEPVLAQPVRIVRSSSRIPVAEVSATAVSSKEREQELYRRLCHVRQQWMRKANAMGESIVSNPVLRELAAVRPSSLECAVRAVQGLPAAPSGELGELLQALISEIQRVCAEFGLPLDCGQASEVVLSLDAVGPGGVKRPQEAVSQAAAQKARRLPFSVWQSGGGAAGAERLVVQESSPWLSARPTTPCTPSLPSKGSDDLERFTFMPLGASAAKQQQSSSSSSMDHGRCALPSATATARVDATDAKHCAAEFDEGACPTASNAATPFTSTTTGKASFHSTESESSSRSAATAPGFHTQASVSKSTPLSFHSPAGLHSPTPGFHSQTPDFHSPAATSESRMQAPDGQVQEQGSESAGPAASCTSGQSTSNFSSESDAAALGDDWLAAVLEM